jgi:hypothetical protein
MVFLSPSRKMQGWCRLLPNPFLCIIHLLRVVKQPRRELVAPPPQLLLLLDWVGHCPLLR